ncbi:PorP/SprF family type IX secretion system membrane protein, partial [Mariniflexile sp. HMF6888]|uniref:PorP/SprF family type IX secretion system membrane protein n=1 Tax=Mariniflexile sp. HMF6888 TaxID=3373086 RepID=UPI0037A71F4D
DRSGVGLSFYNDKNGNTLQKGAKFSFAHHLILDYYSKQYLSLGISYNINSFRIDTSKFTDGTAQPPVSNPVITDDRATTNHNFDVGVLYRNKGFFASFNANNLLEKKIDEDIRVAEPSLLLNYQIYSGYTFRGPKKSGLEFEPSVYYQMFSSDKR